MIVADARAARNGAIKLPDLRSRLAASPTVADRPPDDALMRALLERQFLRRGLDARPELIDWLVARVERSHVALLDARSTCSTRRCWNAASACRSRSRGPRWPRPD